MSGPSDRLPEKTVRRGRIIAVACAAFAFGMVGAAYASVPLYELFCQVTGYGGTTQRADSEFGRVVDQSVVVRFDGNVAPGLAWTFGPNEREITVKLGDTRQTSFHVRNNSDRPVTAQATYNVTPDAAGLYFNKIACFCFDNQTLQPGEEMDMPIVFFIDPDIMESEELKNGRAITLSYTFFPQGGASEPVATAPTDGGTGAATDNL
ncbi:cytochrome c oxidase assembly protein [Aurantimonas aggregata]|uniref:Cytochrome c oxidase assembly protein CtaG n=1 Tax=Aurantimonas aggregata TaxID=2047720 RepID=A0A6L9MDY1_9HYPH|nr:cytochrome c oxidase assembly protein [Aurantimonas aggregata]NDV85965.1 cytochrome c oxidase assembly protein [Aurantimonas aggregata]